MSRERATLLDRLEELEHDLERDLRRAQRRLRQSIPSYIRLKYGDAHGYQRRLPELRRGLKKTR